MDGMLDIEHEYLHGATIVRPVGELTLSTASTLRDGILKQAVEQPRAVIVDVERLTVPQLSLLNVISVVWHRIQQWPGTPLAIVDGSHPPRVGSPPLMSIARAIPVYPTVRAAVGCIGAPPPRLRARTSLVAALPSAERARHFVSETCSAWPVPLDEELCGDAVLVANELVENTLCHTAVPDMVLQLEWSRQWLNVSVRDDDPRHAVVRDPGSTGPGGRGLLIVAQLCTAWGSAPHPNGGKVVWANLATTR